MKRLLCGLMVLGLFFGMAGQGKAQPTYTFTTLDVPGAVLAQFLVLLASGINNVGQIVGWYSDCTGKEHGFLLDQGSYTTLDVPGAQDTRVTGVNASGQIVGSYLDATAQSHGFLLDQGTYTTLDVPGSGYTNANGINDSGQIVGYYVDETGTHGFVATPTP